MRFLTSYFSSIENSSVILTGSKRMRERPISVLVDALRELDVDISYLENEGYPPIRINGRVIKKKQVNLPANVSSQYISSLMMLGVSLQKGLVINLSTEIISLPYIEMTKIIIERNSILLYVIPVDTKNIKKDFTVLQKELIKYNPELADKDFIIAFRKADLMDQELLEEFKTILKQEFKDMEYHIISSVSTFGINELKEDLWNKLNQKN